MRIRRLIANKTKKPITQLLHEAVEKMREVMLNEDSGTELW